MEFIFCCSWKSAENCEGSAAEEENRKMDSCLLFLYHLPSEGTIPLTPEREQENHHSEAAAVEPVHLSVGLHFHQASETAFCS
jgi:hypothetical protein